MESTDRDLLSEWFTQLKGQHVDVSVPQRGYKMDMIKMAHENAETFLEDVVVSGSTKSIRLVGRLRS